MKLTTLSALLAVQLGVAGYLWFSQQHLQQAEPLLADGQISQLVLQQGPADNATTDTARATEGAATPAAPASLTLVRQDQRWWLQLPAKDNDSAGLRVAAAPAKIDTLLNELGQIRLQWPVADSSDSQRRFKVASEAHQWQLSLQTPAGTQRLWLGDSAGLRQLYLRRDGETAIYNVALNSYVLSTDLNQWLDPDQLAVKALQAVRGADFQLVKTDQQWQLAPAAPLTLQAATAGTRPATSAAAAPAGPLPAGQLQADQAASQALADQLQNLKVQSLYQGDWPADALALQLSTAEGDLTLSLAKTGEMYLAKRSDQQAVFRIDAALYQQLSSPTLASLQAKAGDQALASQDKTKPAASSLTPLADKLKPGQTAPAGSAAPQP